MTYDYLCKSCGHAWEAEQRISEEPLKQCPACSELAAKRQISGGSGFILKGGGWYSDLYGSSKAPKSGDSGGSKSSDKAEKAPEKASEAPAACASGACGTSACPAAASS